MANINLYRGGTPVVRFMWNESDWPQFEPPYSVARGVVHEHTPPYDSHADGAYNLGNFVIGMPICPNGVGQVWQKKALAEGVAAGDVLQLIWLPEDHIATFLNLKSVEVDDKLAGATIALVAQDAQYDADGNITFTEDSDFAAAVTAQAGSNSFNLNEPFNAFVSLFTAADGYAIPMYSTPALPAKDSSSSATYAKYKVFGIKVLSVPTDSTVTIADMQKAVYMSLRMEAFECPTNVG